jgi:hypothetical protein
MASLVGVGAVFVYTFYDLFSVRAAAVSQASQLYVKYFPQLLGLGCCVFFALLGVSLLKAGGLAKREAIPERDFELLAPLVTSANGNAIDQYVRLSSLTGFTGNFTKLGLTGLPLTTISVTILFSLLYFFAGEGAKEFLDLAKLTLGAFIGSFVQRQTERDALLREATKRPPASQDDANPPQDPAGGQRGGGGG